VLAVAQTQRFEPDTTFTGLLNWLNDDVLAQLFEGAEDVPRLSPSTLTRLLSSIGIRWTFPVRMERAKFTVRNVTRYAQYVATVLHIDHRRLQFLDEIHFVGKDLVKHRVASFRGCRTVVVSDLPFNDQMHVTFMTRLDNDDDVPYYFEMMSGTNTGRDFAAFLRRCLAEGYLRRGQILVLDNAKVHFTNATIETLQPELDAAGVIVLFLPAYSPELNPCELCFGDLKCFVRHHSPRHLSLALRIVHGFSSLSLAKIVAYYRRCVDQIGGRFHE